MFAVRLTQHGFEPIEPDFHPGLLLVGACLMLLSACVTIGVVAVLVF